MLVVVARAAPVRVIAILLAAARVAPRRRQVTARVRADPHVFIGRRNRELRDAGERARIADALAGRAHVMEPRRRFLGRGTPDAADAARLIADVDETSGYRWHDFSLKALCRCRCRRSTLRDRVVRQPLAGELPGAEEAHGSMRAVFMDELAETAAVGRRIGDDDGEL